MARLARLERLGWRFFIRIRESEFYRRFCNLLFAIIYTNRITAGRVWQKKAGLCYV
ncbi:hypothetical protein DOT_0228 [Desulfosporosinus sp. OT]|nr:hypothetical protein DOT_0228 [Desulfosporosinus sp. OT]